MKKQLLVAAIVLLLASAAGFAQVPSPPVNLQLGLGGGVALPSGKLSDGVNTGWFAGAKLRVDGLIPVRLVATGQYTRLPFKSPSTESMAVYSFGAGIEYAIPSPMIQPYLGVDAMVHSITSTATGATSFTREGLGLGGGVVISVPAFGSIDVSAKYHMLNLMGKDPGEDDLSQISVGASVMFNIL